MEEKEVDLKQFLDVARKHKWLISTIVIAVVALAVVYNIFDIPIYESSATFVLEKSQATEIGGYRVPYDPDQVYKDAASIKAIVQSNSLILSALSDLELDEKPIKQPTINLDFLKFYEEKQDLSTEILNFYRKNIFVTPIGKSNVFQVKVYSQYPEDSANVANELVSSFEEYVSSTNNQILNLSGHQADKQVEALQNKIYQDKQLLERRKTELDYIRVTELQRQIDTYEKYLGELITKRHRKYAEGFLENVDGEQEEIFEEVDQYDEMITELEATIKAKYAEREGLVTSAAMAEINELEKTIETNQKLLTKILENKEVSALAILTLSKQVRILDRALVPIEPVKTRGIINLLVALFLGLGIGLGISYMIESLDTSFKDTNEVEEILKIPVLSIVPDIASLSKNPKPITLEAFRTLRTNLRFIAKNAKVFAFTSATPESGKSLVTSNLALMMNSSEDKVVVIDADLRKSNIHHIFKTERSPGLTDYLEGKVSLKEVVRKIKNKKNLYVITAGTHSDNPQKMLESNKMKNLILSLKKQFDFVLIDSVPSVLWVDAQISASEADATILVLNAKTNKKDEVVAAKKSFISHNCNLVGAVFNKADEKKDRYYYRYKYTDVNQK
jgi:capsular exopolysaccharide synthesis family protein